MKTNYFKINILFILGLMLVFTACKEEYYHVNDKFYDGMKIVVKNPLSGDTLRIEQFNSDQITIKEMSDSTVVFDSKSFIYTVEKEGIISIGSDGTITPLSRGTTKLDIIFRANNTLKTSIVVEIYKDYHAVDYLQAASSVSKLLIEKNYTLNLPSYIFVYPAHADNKLLHYTLGAGSDAFASIDANGVITGKAPGIIQVHVASDDNPLAILDLQLTVVNEIEITDILLHSKLNNVTLGIGEKINLKAVTSVAPANVNVVNRNLTFEVVSGTDVVSIDPTTGMLTAQGGGTAVVKATSKNGITKEFTINVDATKKDLTRTFWTVATSVKYSNGLNYVVDGTTGKPEDMLDENTATFLSLVKPGKTYNGSVAVAGIYNYFIVDMQTPSKFNSVRWNHRSGNSYTYLRVWGVKLEGSNDAENWTDIGTELAIPSTKGAPNGNVTTRFNMALDKEYEYRYVKVIMSSWSDNSGGSTSGSTMQIGEFGLSEF